MHYHNFYIYGNFDYSEKSAGATRVLYYAKALADNSHKVYLVSCCSNKLSDEKFVEIEPNIYVLKKKKLTTSFFGTLSFLRELESFSNAKKGGKTFIFHPALLISIEILSLVYLKAIKRHSVFYELNEVPIHSSTFHAPISLTKLKYSLKKVIFRTQFTLIEPLLFFYDGLICISTSMEKYGSKFKKNTLRIPILTDPDITIETTKNVYSVKGAINVGFSGSIDPSKEDLENFIDVISKVKKKGYHISFNLCGAIAKSYRNNFLEKCKSRNEINYYGFLNEKELSSFLVQQDLLVIPRGYSLQNQYGFSTKLSDYLNHQKIILMTDISDNKLYIKDGVNGFIVPPNDKELMYEKLLYIIDNFDDLKKTIIPNALFTSKNEFHYKIYGTALRKFLIQK